MCCRCSVTQKKVWVFGCGSLFALIALIFGLLWPSLSLTILHNQLVLKEGSLSYQNWIETPIPMYLEFFFFDWENPEDMNKKSIKPKLVERGPYVFLEKHKRVDLDWHNNNSISFNQIRTWEFDEGKSNGKLTDKITGLNVIALTVANMMKDKDAIMKLIANYMLNHKDKSPYVTKTVKEWLFDGFDDPLLTFLKKLHLPDFNIPFDKFGWFADRNGSETYDGRFTMYTGEDDVHKIGVLTHWNYEKHTKFYKNDCGVVNGTTGELWPADMISTDTKTVFGTDICRQITLKYNKTVEFYGIEGSHYIGDDSVFDNGIKYRETRCNCQYEDSKKCPKTGLLDISTCRYGAPVFVSYPHFYLADKSYLTGVSGLKPDPSKHEFTLALETKTGIPLYVNARLQVNVHLQPYKDFDYYKDVPDVMMPMFWFRQTAALDDHMAGQAKLAVNISNIGVYLAYGLGALGILVIVIGVILTITKRWSKRTHDDEELLTNH